MIYCKQVKIKYRGIFMSTQGNNYSKEIAHLRDTFFGKKNFNVRENNNGNGEAVYLKQLLRTNPEARELFKKYVNLPASVLFDQAKLRIEMIDNGEIPNEKLELVEAEIALFLGAIEDAHLVKSLELTPDDEMTL